MDVVDQEEETDGRVSSHRSNPRPNSWNTLNRAPTQDADEDDSDSTSGSSEDIE
jgi:hypothetical protein